MFWRAAAPRRLTSPASDAAETGATPLRYSVEKLGHAGWSACSGPIGSIVCDITAPSLSGSTQGALPLPRLNIRQAMNAGSVAATSAPPVGRLPRLSLGVSCWCWRDIWSVPKLRRRFPGRCRLNVSGKSLAGYPRLQLVTSADAATSRTQSLVLEEAQPLPLRSAINFAAPEQPPGAEGRPPQGSHSSEGQAVSCIILRLAEVQ